MPLFRNRQVIAASLYATVSLLTSCGAESPAVPGAPDGFQTGSDARSDAGSDARVIGDTPMRADGKTENGNPDAPNKQDAGAIADTGAVADTGHDTADPPGTPAIHYFGRWDMSDANNPSASWGAVGLKAKFEGTSVSIKLNDATNSFVYSIDDGPLQVLGPFAPSQPLLASGLTNGIHTLAFFRRSEGGYGRTVVGGLVLDPGKRLLPPDPRPPRKIEVLGNSISAGFGNEGMGGNTPQSQNGYMAYGPQVARMLDAEWSIIAHSGQGMYRNLCEALPPVAAHMPDEFKQLHHPAVPGPQWDFSKWKPDVLIIELGTNDYADYPAGSCAPPSNDGFKTAYAQFLTFARSVYPNAEIFALGTFIATASNMFSTCNQTICAAVAQQGDPKMHCIDPSLGPEAYWLVGPGDYIGDWTHPTIAGHTKLATRLRDVIKPIMGW